MAAGRLVVQRARELDVPIEQPQDKDDGKAGEIVRRNVEYIAQLQALRAWYREVLQLPELYAFPGLAFFDLGGVRLMLTEKEGDTGLSESILYLRVPDVHSAKDELESRGVKFTHAPHLIHRHEDGTEEWMAFFEDNEDRPLALMTQVRSVVR